MKKTSIFLLLFTLISIKNYSQKANEYIYSPPAGFENKIGGGDLVQTLSQINLNKSLENNLISVVLYFKNYPSNSFVDRLSELNTVLFMDSWTPPVGSHPYGFIFAEIDPNYINEIIKENELIRIEYSGKESFPQGSSAVDLTNADLAWIKGLKGKGIKIAILDSGLDTEPANLDLSSTLTKKDYSKYPTLGNNVENMAISHGTHVTSAAVGLGNHSLINSNGNYSGISPEADLIFLKIGNNSNGGASTKAITNALDAAVNIYQADLINLSYGSWDLYHDGSNTKDQKVDWCYEQGVPVFLASGNDANLKKHFSGSVNSHDSTDFIEVKVNNAASNTYLAFNLVWFDSFERRNLTVKYYNSSFQEISEVFVWSTSESIKGTESQTSQTYYPVPAGNSVYYLKVINNSDYSQQYHLYEHFDDGKVTFANPDPNYTITSPATATYGFSVGAYTSRDTWTAANGYIGSFGETLNNIASFSGRGPRIDGLQKPDIVAPGSGVITLRDRDVQTSQNNFWIDNDGVTGGASNYYIVSGTSFASPIAAGCAAILLQKFPGASPEQVYNALRNNSIIDSYTGNVPNSTYGYGKVDIAAALEDSVLLSQFSVSVNASVFLQGAYNSGVMRTSLFEKNYLPLNQPYAASPWNYEGTESAASFSPDIVDWVLVELRTHTSSSSIVGKRAALLKSDGSIVDIDGTSQVRFYGVTAGEYYLVVKHKNHLPVMSAVPVQLSVSSALYDFTASLSYAYQISSIPMKDLGDGNFGMFAGDVNNDGVLTYSGRNNDRAAILTRLGGSEVSSSIEGYFNEDVDLNGCINYNGNFSDKDMILSNIGNSDITLIRKTEVPD